MIIYLQVILLFLFSAVMSATIGFVIYLVIDKLIFSTVIKHIVGLGVTILTGYFITELLIFSGIWYYYVGTIILAGLLYVLFIILLSKHFR